MSLRRSFSLALLTALILAQPLRADQPASRPTIPESFLQFVDDGHGGGSLQSAELTMQNAQGVTLHLVAAIHIGEKAYYDALNQDFRNDDAVLYEMVMPKDSQPPPPPGVFSSDDTTRPQSEVSKFQRFLKDTLQLDFQLDDIDYTQPNFIHADLDTDTFQQMQAARGESFESLFMQQILASLNEQPKPGEDPDAQSLADIVHVLTRPDMERQIKVVIARQLGDMDSAAMGLDGPQGSVILTERNKAALATLASTLQAGKKNIAIFYGAAHMPDMAKRLQALGFVAVSTQWHMAWNLKIRPDQPSAIELMLSKMFGPATRPD
ncbi:MAG: hypothetical protein ABSF29_04010 [Tepidisphaeraceae bacterium]|jgi:hypothetical protein